MSAAVRWHAPALEAAAGGGDAAAARPLRLPTLQEIQAIEEAAYREGLQRGRDEGYADGQAQGGAEVRRLAARIEGILDNFSRPLDRLENETVAALSELAARIAGSLVGHAYRADPALLAGLAQEALEAVGSGQREVELRLHPEDMAALAPVFTAPAGVRLSADAALGRGDLRVHAENMFIDGTQEARVRGVLDRMLARGLRG